MLQHLPSRTSVRRLRPTLLNLLTRPVILLAVAAVMSTAVAARAPQGTPPKPTTPVTVKALQALLPAPIGWDLARSGGNQVAISDSCTYAFADATFLNGDLKVRVTLADTGFNADSLAALATMVVSFPDDYSDTIPPATTIKRLKVGDWPAASRWDADKGDGEFTLLVAGRFVATAEGSHVDSLDTLRAIIEQIDLQKLAALK